MRCSWEKILPRSATYRAFGGTRVFHSSARDLKWIMYLFSLFLMDGGGSFQKMSNVLSFRGFITVLSSRVSLWN